MNLTFKIIKPIFTAKLILIIFLYLQLIGLNPLPEVNYGTVLSETGVGNIIRQLLFICLLAAAFKFIGFNKGSIYYLYYNNKALFALVFIAALSFFWSLEPGATLRRSFLLFIVCAIPVMLAVKIGFNNFVKINASILSVLIFLSFISCFFISGTVHRGEVLDESLNGSWRGFFGHKNSSAIIAAISSFIFLYMFLEERKKYWVFMLLISVFFLLMTQSKTTISLFLPILLISFFLSRHGAIKYSILFVLAISLVVPISFFTGYDEINSFLIDNPELFTGRATIWQVMLEAIPDRPLAGFGYGAVWSAGEYSAIADYGINTSAWVGTVSHGHNGYLDLWVSCGLFALSSLIFILIASYRDVCHASKYTANHRFLCISIFVFLMFHNFLESSFVVYSSPGWYFFIFAYCVKFQEAKY
jgi:exopolysaccharide production protein ExoQ